MIMKKSAKADFFVYCTFLYAKEKYEKKRATLQVDGLSVACGDGIVRT